MARWDHKSRNTQDGLEMSRGTENRTLRSALELNRGTTISHKRVKTEGT